MSEKTANSGFTLMEMLIVVSIIAILIAIAVPVTVRQLEVSRETADLANVRSKYAEILQATLTGDTSYLGAEGVYTATVPLKQKKEGWTYRADDYQTALSIAGFTYANGGMVNLPGTACTITYTPSTYQWVFDWGGEATVAIDWSNFSAAANAVNALCPDSKSSYSGVIYSTDMSNLTAQEKALLNELRTKLGVSGDVAIYYNKNIYTRKINISVVEGALLKDDFTTNGQYGKGCYAIRVTYDYVADKTDKVVSQYGKWGVNGTTVGFWSNDFGGKFPTDELYVSGG